MDGDFGGPSSSPAPGTLQERVKHLRVEADIALMDANGAKLLAARIRAGVSIGMRIELVDDAGDDSGLSPGDRGVVKQIDNRGNVVVNWDRGFVSEIDPERTRFQPLAA